MLGLDVNLTYNYINYSCQIFLNHELKIINKGPL